MSAQEMPEREEAARAICEAEGVAWDQATSHYVESCRGTADAVMAAGFCRAPDSSRVLWNVRLPDGSLWFARGTAEKASRERAANLPDSAVVTCRAIPAHQTDWTEA